MMIMTAKVNPKKAIVLLLAAAALLVGLILLCHREDPVSPTTAAPDATAPTAEASGAASNEDRVKFLTQLGWDAAASPVQTGRIKIPATEDPVFSRYNDLQKSIGYDLSAYAGKICNRYVYKIRNYPGASAPVYATVLVYENQIIGGDITDTSPQGQVRPLQKAASVG